VAIRRRSPGRVPRAGGTINWGIFKRHFWGELLWHQQQYNLQQRVHSHALYCLAKHKINKKPAGDQPRPSPLDYAAADGRLRPASRGSGRRRFTTSIIGDATGGSTGITATSGACRSSDVGWIGF
jgi:hypothetical protein